MNRWLARAGTALATLLVGLGLQAPALAKKVTRDNADLPRPQHEQASPHAGLTLDQIIAAAEKRHGARVKRWDETTEKGRRIYVLRLQKDGKVWEIKVDADTGKEL